MKTSRDAINFLIYTIAPPRGAWLESFVVIVHVMHHAILEQDCRYLHGQRNLVHFKALLTYSNYCTLLSCMLLATCKFSLQLYY